MADALDPRRVVDRSGYSRAGFAERFDRTRPQAPSVLPALLAQLAGVERPAFVVDLGSGTGLSTRLWAGHAEAVVGIEPNAAMRAVAEAHPAHESAVGVVTYRDALASATGLPAGSADVVTCAQALHWLEPVSTLAEVARLLRLGGVFAASDYDWPPTMDWAVEAAFLALEAHTQHLCQVHGIEGAASPWPKRTHLDRLRASGHFRSVKAIGVHHVELGDADRLVGLARTDRGIAGLLERGLTEAELGLDTLRAVARRTFGDQPVPWYFSYRVCIGVR